MNIHQLTPKTPRTYAKRVGRGGQRGKTSGKGTKGQASRAGAGIKPGFRGGDSRPWQSYPKQRGASKKPGNSAPHRKHRFYQLRHEKPATFGLDLFNQFAEGQEITSEFLFEKGILDSAKQDVKVLDSGTLKKRLTFKGLMFSAGAKAKAEKAGASVL